MARTKADIFSLCGNGLTLIMDEAEIELFLPHRRKALKIDAIVFSPSDFKSISGFKKIKDDDPDLDGHFDSKPVYPGVSIAECANLTAAMLILIVNEDLIGYPTAVAFSCECKRPVFPGDDIEIKVNLISKKEHRGQDFYGFSYVVKKTCNGKSKIVAEGKITGTAT